MVNQPHLQVPAQETLKRYTSRKTMGVMRPVPSPRGGGALPPKQSFKPPQIEI